MGYGMAAKYHNNQLSMSDSKAATHKFLKANTGTQRMQQQSIKESLDDTEVFLYKIKRES